MPAHTRGDEGGGSTAGSSTKCPIDSIRPPGSQRRSLRSRGRRIVNRAKGQPPIGPGASPRQYPGALPASGAWRVGDHAGRRQFLTIAADHPMALEGGGVLNSATVAYETWGQLDGAASNAILVCHALTGDAACGGRLRARGIPRRVGGTTSSARAGRSTPTAISLSAPTCSAAVRAQPGRLRPTRRRAARMASAFPVVTIRDMVRAQARLADHLGVRRWLSRHRRIDGRHAGDRVGGHVPAPGAVVRRRSASCAAASAWQIAWSAVGRTAPSRSTQSGIGGDYYDAAPGEGPHAGLAVARAIAQITYRSDEVFSDRFDSDRIDSIDAFRCGIAFRSRDISIITGSSSLAGSTRTRTLR